MPQAGFEPAISAGERLQTHVLDRSATGIGNEIYIRNENEEGLIQIVELLKIFLPVL